MRILQKNASRIHRLYTRNRQSRAKRIPLRDKLHPHDTRRHTTVRRRMSVHPR